MPTAVTKDIKISVEVSHQGSELSHGDVFHGYAYRITISNYSDYTIQLLRRHWFVNDIMIGTHEVEGEGVVGQQPIIEPGMSHTYVSGVSIQSNFGTMHGFYVMERVLDGHQFQVKIPLFQLNLPAVSN
jgi:ApaG protein